MEDRRDDAELLKAAADDDGSAWVVLEARFGPRMWHIARVLGLSEADSADAVQGAWLRLLEHLHTIRDPARIGAWLTTTARREALLIFRRGDAERRIARLPEEDPLQPDPESVLMEADEARRLWQAISTLHEPCRTLLRLVATEVSHQQLALRLGVPVGSVGPTRARCLNSLRTLISSEELVQSTTPV